MVLSLAEIDRGVFHAIRKQIVLAGYLPDILSFQPSSGPNKTAFQAAKDAIIGSGKELIEIYGVGDNGHRDSLVKNKIIIDRDIPRIADVGFFGNVQFIPNGDPSNPATTFTRTNTPAFTYKIDYNVTYICTSTKYDRILEAMIRKALFKTYLKPYDEDGIVINDIFNFLPQSNPMNMIDEKFIERMYKFMAGEVLLDENEIDESRTSIIVQAINPILEPYPVIEIDSDAFEQSS